MTNQLRIAPPPTTVQQRIAPPTPTYCVWAMDGKGNSRRIFSRFHALEHAQHGAYLVLKQHPNDFVYIVGWCGYKCIGHWHNLFGPNTNDTNWKSGDIRKQVRAFIKPARRTHTHANVLMEVHFND